MRSGTTSRLIPPLLAPFQTLPSHHRSASLGGCAKEALNPVKLTRHDLRGMRVYLEAPIVEGLERDVDLALMIRTYDRTEAVPWVCYMALIYNGYVTNGGTSHSRGDLTFPKHTPTTLAPEVSVHPGEQGLAANP